MEHSIHETLGQAVSLHVGGELKDAEDLYRGVLLELPDQAEANHNLGILRVADGRPDVALPFFMRAIKENPASERFWFSYAACLIEQKDFENAEQTLRDMRHAGLETDELDVLERKMQCAAPDKNTYTSGASTPSDRTHNAQQENKIDAYQWKIAHGGPTQVQLDTLAYLCETGDLDKAKKLGLSLAEGFPDHPFAWKILGSLMLQSGSPNESLMYLQQATALAPERAENHFYLGNAMSVLGRLDEARECYERAVVLDPCPPEAHFNLGNTFREFGELERAKASFCKAVESRPEYAEAHFNLAKTLCDLGRVGDAAQSYQNAITSQPDFAEAYFNLANLSREQGRLADARVSYLQAIDATNDFAEAHGNLGVTLYELGKFEDAAASLQRAVELKSDFAKAHSTLGVIFSELCRHEEAERSHRKAVELSPDMAEAHCNLGVTLHALEKLNEAEEAFTRALQLKPGYTDALLNRSCVRFELGQVDDALHDLDSCDTDDARARALELLYAAGRSDEIYARLSRRLSSDDSNIRMAAFSVFISHKLEKPVAHRFCEAPLDFFYSSNLDSSIEDSEVFTAELIEEVKSLETDWEPAHRSTKGGFQLPNHLNIFDQKSEKIARLENVICRELDQYYSAFGDKPCALIDRWPKEKKLLGWHVILKRQGCQAAHIHPSGWISGVVYLQVTPDLGKNEGALELSYDGELYSHANSPRMCFSPGAGDIVLFPSSLHHRTLPFTTDTDRIVIAFDLLPSPSVLNWRGDTWS